MQLEVRFGVRRLVAAFAPRPPVARHFRSPVHKRTRACPLPCEGEGGRERSERRVRGRTRREGAYAYEPVRKRTSCCAPPCRCRSVPRDPIPEPRNPAVRCPKLHIVRNSPLPPRLCVFAVKKHSPSRATPTQVGSTLSSPRVTPTSPLTAWQPVLCLWCRPLACPRLVPLLRFPRSGLGVSVCSLAFPSSFGFRISSFPSRVGPVSPVVSSRQAELYMCRTNPNTILPRPAPSASRIRKMRYP